MQPAATEIVIWDRFVRFFHWSTASLFLTEFWLLEAGDPPHEWAGYMLGGMLLARIVWGFVGSPNARFSHFYPTQARLKAHIENMRQGSFDPAEGHNPLGGTMVLFLLLMLGLTVVSGWLLTCDDFWGEDWLEAWHGWLAGIMQVAVAIHVSAVVFMEYGRGMHLIRPMLTGKRIFKPSCKSHRVPESELKSTENT